MTKPSLPQCDFLGPVDPEDLDERLLLLPEDWTGDSFDYVPEEYELSGGYLRSEIACFRAPKPADQHQARLTNLRKIQSLAERNGLRLPDSFVRLAMNDELVNRIWHH